jgi:hypothetical protein
MRAIRSCARVLIASETLVRVSYGVPGRSAPVGRCRAHVRLEADQDHTSDCTSFTRV